MAPSIQPCRTYMTCARLQDLAHYAAVTKRMGINLSAEAKAVRL